MRRALAAVLGSVLVLVPGFGLGACGGSRPVPVPPGDLISARFPVEYSFTFAQRGDPRVEHRAAVLRELEIVDRELDAIDEELAASAIASPPSRDGALAMVTSLIDSLQRTSPETLFADTPHQLIRIASAYSTAVEHDARLGTEYGARHPDRIEQRRMIVALRATFDRQREVELAEAVAWRAELRMLAQPSTAAKIRQANRRALQTVLARFIDDAIAPSDAPADVRVATLRVTEALRRIEVAAPSLGPKHPEMIALAAESSAARAALRTAIAAADTQLLREIATLDSPRPRGPEIEPARLARRAELAARARDLRREWDALRPTSAAGP